MNPSRMELARELTPNSSPTHDVPETDSNWTPKSTIDCVDRGMTATPPLVRGMGSKNSLAPHEKNHQQMDPPPKVPPSSQVIPDYRRETAAREKQSVRVLQLSSPLVSYVLLTQELRQQHNLVPPHPPQEHIIDVIS